MTCLEVQLPTSGPAPQQITGGTGLPSRDLLKQLQSSARPTQLSQRAFRPTMTAIALNWGAILGCMAALAFLPIYLHPVWLVIIAARQHALLILMHDASHFLFCRSKAWNDLISDLFCGFPFGVTTSSYRANHLRHHEHLNTAEDPDLVRTVGPHSDADEWLFPMPHKRLLGFFVKDVFGRGFIYIISALKELAETSRQSRQAKCEYRMQTLVRVAQLGVIILLAVLSHHPWLIAYGWFVPMFIVVPALLRLRALAEHFALPRTHLLNETRTVRAHWGERVLIAPHNVGMHLEHHLFPFVPWFRLPELHDRLMQVEAYRSNAHISGGYLSGRASLWSDVVKVQDDPRLALDRHSPSAR